MRKNKISIVFLDHDVIQSNIGKKLGIDRNGEIKSSLESLDKIRNINGADQIVLVFTGDNEAFKDHIKKITSEFTKVIRDVKKEDQIILGNHFDHQSIFSCDGENFTNDERDSSRNSNEIIGDKIEKYTRIFTDENEIANVIVARNNIGETITLTNFFDKFNISFMHCTFDPHTTANFPPFPLINYNENKAHVNWMDFTALNMLLLNKAYLEQKKLEETNAEKEALESTKQQIIVYKD